jgi:hypothetical protein
MAGGLTGPPACAGFIEPAPTRERRFPNTHEAGAHPSCACSPAGQGSGERGLATAVTDAVVYEGRNPPLFFDINRFQ